MKIEHLTDSILTQFIGGQIEIIDSEPLRMFRGEINAILLQNGNISINLEWNAEFSEGKWTRNGSTAHQFSLYKADFNLAQGRLIVTVLIASKEKQLRFLRSDDMEMILDIKSKIG